MVRVPRAGPQLPIRLRGVRYLRFGTGSRRASGRESGAPLGNTFGGSPRSGPNRLNELFCPSAEAWQSQVLERSLELVGSPSGDA